MEINSTADIDALITPASHAKWLVWFRDQLARLGAPRICRITGASLADVHRWQQEQTAVPRYQKLGLYIYITTDNQER
jgi:hypothetical protein